MKKLLALSAVLAFGLTACGNDGTSSSTNNSTPAPTPATKKVNVGTGYHVKFDAGQVDFTTAMVAFDTNGKVVGARIDVVQVVVSAGETSGLAIAATHPDTYENEGKNEDGTIKTKLELGEDYAMNDGFETDPEKNAWLDKNKDGIVLEVDEQIESYAKWTVGKTVDEVKAGNDLPSTCSITVDAFAAAVESAYSLKSETTYDVPEFTTGVAVNVNVYDNETVDFDLGGALVADGKVLAASVDCVALQFTVTDGTVAEKEDSHYRDADTGAYLSKKTLGDAYAMNDGFEKDPVANAWLDKNKDGIVLEWYEQAAVVETACVGKTAAQVAELKQATGELATATMNCGTYIGAVAKAATYAPLAQIGK